MNNEYTLITGASSGIGAQVAILLSHKYNIVLNGRDDERLNNVKNRCSKGDHRIWKYDLKGVNDVEAALSTFISENDIKISYFVHCAGMMKNVPVKMFTTELFTNTFNINVVAAAMVMKVLSGKRPNNKALKSAVFISSNISNFGAKAHSVYGASKAALDGLMRSLAMELAPNVRINSVLPGGIKTAMTAHIFEDENFVKNMESSYPLGLGNTADIANVVEFLLSENSKWMTGQQIVVDGGRTINLTV
jgi:NAD(P)-dependent dehydrogenase (short-subunit alcohol dehydrogenase family)